MMNELLVRALTPVELADRLADSDDFAVRELAKHVIDDDIGERDFEAEIDDANDARDEAEAARQEAEGELESIKKLLVECVRALKITADNVELIDRIKAAM